MLAILSTSNRLNYKLFFCGIHIKEDLTSRTCDIFGILVIYYEFSSSWYVEVFSYSWHIYFHNLNCYWVKAPVLEGEFLVLLTTTSVDFIIPVDELLEDAVVLLADAVNEITR